MVSCSIYTAVSTNPFSVSVRLIYHQILHIVIREGSGEKVSPLPRYFLIGSNAD